MQPEKLFAFDAKALKGVQMTVLSPNRKWVAARGNAGRVEIRSFPDGREEKVIDGLTTGHRPESVAFTPDGRSLAVGIMVEASGSRFFYELNGEVLLYDLRHSHPEVTVIQITVGEGWATTRSEWRYTVTSLPEN